MQRRALGNSAVRITPIGVGCAPIGCDPRAWGRVDDNESIAAIHAALDLGLNWFDVAPSYGAGHAEEVLGKALQGRRDDAVVVTKCGRPLDAGSTASRCLAAEVIERECDASLRRLRTDRIDLYLCQASDPLTPLEETIDALVKLLDHGKVQAIGAADFSCELLVRWQQIGPLHAVMHTLNLFEQESARDLLPFAIRHNVAFLAGSPFCRGLLCGSAGPTSRYADLRARDPQFLRPRFQPNLDAVGALRPIAARRERPLCQLAVAWVLAQPGVTGVVAGAKRASQVRQFAGGADWALTAEERAGVADVIRVRNERLALLL